MGPNTAEVLPYNLYRQITRKNYLVTHLSPLFQTFWTQVGLISHSTYDILECQYIPVIQFENENF